MLPTNDFYPRLLRPDGTVLLTMGALPPDVARRVAQESLHALPGVACVELVDDARVVREVVRR